jgi:hypothetical protein
MYSHTVSYFHKAKKTNSEHPLLKPVFNQHSYEVFQFLEKQDLNNLKCTNQFFLEICDCHSLFTDSIKGLHSLFINSIAEEVMHKETKPFIKEKNSKFKEKFNFNKSMNEFYKGSDILNQRLQSGKKKK